MRESLRAACALVLLGGLAGCAGRPVEPLTTSLQEDVFGEHVSRLSSDEFQGRKPGTAGETATIAYLVEQCRRLGLKPGNGSDYLQNVPLLEISADPAARLSFSAGHERLELAYGRDVLIWSRRAQPESRLEASEVVFAGHGVVAPDYNWDDYAQVDVRGKTVVLLGGDPAPFKARAMTAHGRWSHKLEEAARHGAAGVILIHEEARVGYGWDAVRGSRSGAQLQRADAGDAGRAAVEGWISTPAAQAVFKFAGQDLAALSSAAEQRGFTARPLGLRADALIHSSQRTLNSANVVAVLPGAERPREYVLYSAHWDGLGSSTGPEGTRIFPGAIDNASGVAAVLTIAQTLSRLPQHPPRSVVFFFGTAQQSDLLGSAWYVDHPLFALKDTAAVINVDRMHIGGPTRDVTVVGYGQSELDNYLRVAATLQGREAHGELEPQHGAFYGSDQFSFARGGVPALMAGAGVDDTARGPAWGRAQLQDYFLHRYQQPADRYSADWDLRGTLQDLELYLALGERLAHEWRFPHWNPSSEFRAVRERQRPEDRNGRPVP